MKIDDGPVGGLLTYFDTHGLFRQWYWPENTHGKLWNFLHGNGWNVL